MGTPLSFTADVDWTNHIFLLSNRGRDEWSLLIVFYSVYHVPWVHPTKSNICVECVGAELLTSCREKVSIALTKNIAEL